MRKNLTGVTLTVRSWRVMLKTLVGLNVRFAATSWMTKNFTTNMSLFTSMLMSILKFRDHVTTLPGEDLAKLEMAARFVPELGEEQPSCKHCCRTSLLF